ncbi:MAG: alpha-amylase family glycosyl hydrolase, partial [Candidatus Gastranaerophilaceae bacterium]
MIKKLNSFGAAILPNGKVQFDFWAPDASNVKLCIKQKNDELQEIQMQKTDEGWYSLVTDQAKNKTLYCYKVNNNLNVPDPASYYQPFDVNGLSQVIDHSEFDWGNDSDWQGRPWEETVLYELHVGTFTKEGTFKALKEKLDYFVPLNVTAIEIMPVGDFPGKRNWGYDEVLKFAPSLNYGTPDDLKDLIKTAHEKNIEVFLDVVYNHFGPDGNYLYVYAKSKFFNTDATTPWGSAINFNNKNVRKFFVENAIYWLKEYHFDGLRLDAVHAIKDDSSPNILEELAFEVEKTIGKNRYVHLILENDNNEAKYLEKSGYSAQLNDDFHHCIHILTTGEDNGYYQDYTVDKTGKPASYYVARALA